ncbi:MAG: DEAD/DEAH box helicase family protein [Thermodesulfobacteriota bacterium]
MMKFKFDPNQDFQLDATNSIVDIFEGHVKPTADIMVASGGLWGAYPNYMNLSGEEILANVKKVQERNKIKNGVAVDDLDFSVEMETGTGKTYVYIRTVLELNKKYGWKKFIVIVPSVAIREGVIKTLEITKEHFHDLYGGVPYRFYEYQSKNISQVRHFASSSNIEIMIMTMGSFNRDENLLYTERDQMQGEQPISYIQKTNPVLILDEPQNMEGEATQEKLKNFNSLFRLRYSATHRNFYNLMYRLTPYDAYQKGLVKKIEVLSVLGDDGDAGSAFVRLVDVSSTKNKLRAKVEVFVMDKNSNLKKAKVTLTDSDDLAKKTNNSVYSGYIVGGMKVHAPDYGSFGSIRFKNGITIKQGEDSGESREDIMKRQIAETIRLHFEKKDIYKKEGIKVLSLFFIDRVDNYVQEDGIIRTMFIKEFNNIKKEFGYASTDVAKVHKGYFAISNDQYLVRESSIAENKDAFELILRDKERLLSFEEPTEFIFTHSALKEGWDNPNVFNICTLRTTSSQIRKRQEIGRGMRLCVNQEGERLFLRHINLLSVVANESYSDYVGQLQAEFIEDGIYDAPQPYNARKKYLIRTKKGFEKDKNFQAIWSHISKKTTYKVNVNTNDLIRRCSKRINELTITKPKIRSERAAVDITEAGIEARLTGVDVEELKQQKKQIDCVNFIKNETKLTRKTVASILKNSQNSTSFLNSPEKFTFEASRIIREELMKDYIGQITYEILPETYQVDQFENIPSYRDSIQPVDHSIYDAIVYESSVEKRFAVDLDHDERIKLFIKLPGWFTINTPLGTYNPDWAIVTAKVDLRGKESKEKVYFVIETKGDLRNLREDERAKITTAKKHFEVIDVKYKEVESYDQFKQEFLSS